MPHRLTLRVVVLALALVSIASLGACAPEDPGEAGGGLDNEVDAGPGPADGGPAATCEPPATALPNGMHNPGLACKGCHNGTTAPNWKVAGTLYATAQGGAPIAGATITITDANNVKTKLVTASNGNFYTPANIVFPIRVGASKCPDTRTMVMAAPIGDCNSCHGAGARIHLP